VLLVQQHLELGADGGPAVLGAGLQRVLLAAAAHVLKQVVHEVQPADAQQTLSRQTADAQQAHSRRSADAQQTLSRHTADAQQAHSRRSAGTRRRTEVHPITGRYTDIYVEMYSKKP